MHELLLSLNNKKEFKQINGLKKKKKLSESPEV